MPDTDDSGSFTWTDAPAEPRGSWARIVLATIGIGLLVGVLIAVGGFVLLGIYR